MESILTNEKLNLSTLPASSLEKMSLSVDPFDLEQAHTKDHSGPLEYSQDDIWLEYTDDQIFLAGNLLLPADIFQSLQKKQRNLQSLFVLWLVFLAESAAAHTLYGCKGNIAYATGIISCAAGMCQAGIIAECFDRAFPGQHGYLVKFVKIVVCLGFGPVFKVMEHMYCQGH